MRNGQARAAFMKLVESVFGPLSEVEWHPTTFRFRAEGQLSFAKLVELSKILKTDAIDVDLGRSDEPDLSDVTPGERGYGGWITVHLTDKELQEPLPSEKDMRLLSPAQLCSLATSLERQGLTEHAMTLRMYGASLDSRAMKCCVHCGTVWAGRDEEHTVGCPKLEGLGS